MRQSSCCFTTDTIPSIKSSMSKGRGISGPTIIFKAVRAQSKPMREEDHSGSDHKTVSVK